MRPKERCIVSARVRWEYLQAVHPRYRQARRGEKQRILDEFCRVAGYHRKYAIRLLNQPAPPGPRAPRRRPVTYGVVIRALHAIWQAAGYPWSVRLKDYVRYDSPAALAAINSLYRHELRLLQNLF